VYASCSWKHAKKYEVMTMIYVTAAVSIFLFVYLWAAMIRPEKF